jgi:OFA family oxalate/formate antiporter-like MFS transporter
MGNATRPQVQESKGLFYGWVIVAFCFLGLSLSFSPIVGFTFGVTLGAVTREFHWARTQVSVAYSLALLAMSVANPVMGRLADRFGPRRVIAASLLAMAIGLASLFFLSSNLIGLYGRYLFLGWVGAGTLFVPYSRLISSWFVRRRGTALALAMLGSAFGGFVAPSLSLLLIQHWGWRVANVWLGVLVALGAVAMLLALEDTPGARGMVPDGKIVDVASSASKPIESSTVSAALRSRTFWFIAAAVLLSGMGTASFTVHLVPLLRDAGAADWVSALATSTIGAGMVVGRLISGPLLDRRQGVLVATLYIFSLAVGVVPFAAGSAGVFAFLGAFMIGTSLGGVSSTGAYLVAHFFGLRAFAEIYGYTLAAFTVGGMCGPVLMGASFDHFHSYRPALLLLEAGVITAASLVFSLRNRKHALEHIVAPSALQPSMENASK